MTTILDPTDERVPVARSITRRPAAIRGSVALLDIAKPRGNVLLIGWKSSSPNACRASR